MIRFRCFIFIFLFLNVCCTQFKNEKIKDDEKIKKYSLIYTNNSYFKMVVYDNNDTIYFYNKSNKYNTTTITKINSDKETVNEIRNAIVNHLSFKSLLIERDVVLPGGYLDISIDCGDNKIQIIQSRVDKMRVSQDVYSLINKLKNKYKKVENML